MQDVLSAAIGTAILTIFIGMTSLMLFEQLGVLALDRFTFRTGPRAVVSERTSAMPEGLKSPISGETASVKYRVTDTGDCLFRRKYFPHVIRLNMPLELKGMVTWRDGTLSVIGRYPLGQLVFFTFWMLGVTVGAAFLMTATLLAGVVVLVVAASLLGWTLWLSRAVELSRFERYADEVTQALGVEAAPAAPRGSDT